MNIKAKIEKLEERLKTDATVCPHLPPIVKYFEPDGEPDTTHGIPDETPCKCGRDRMRIHVQYVKDWRSHEGKSAAEMTEEELEAIIDESRKT